MSHSVPARRSTCARAAGRRHLPGPATAAARAGRNHDPDEVCPAGVVATHDPGGSVTAGSTETVGVWVHDGEVPYAATGSRSCSAVSGTAPSCGSTPPDVARRPLGGDRRAAAGGPGCSPPTFQGPDFAGGLTLDPIQVEPAAAATRRGPSTIPCPPVPPWLALAAVAALVAALGGGMVARNRAREASAQG